MRNSQVGTKRSGRALLGIFSMIGFLSSAPGVARAETCPTAADLETGIVLTEKGPRGSVVTIQRRVSPDIILSGGYVTPRETRPSMTTRSHAGFLSLQTVENGRLLEDRSYDPPPAEIMPFSGNTRYRARAGDRDFDFVVDVAERGRVSLGGCSYDAIHLRMRTSGKLRSGKDFESVTERVYIPALAYATMGTLKSVGTLEVRHWRPGDPVIEDFRGE